ncbi:hypothetical protein OIU76_020006 [Salix suchowensis]|nr:hypothetical protein OIU76_020006 [Salix suchowensis]
MGNFCSISISCDKLLSGCLDFTFEKVVCISKLKENVNRLQIAVDELIDLHSDVKRRVEVSEEQQLKQLDQVRRWISRADAAISKSNELLRYAPQEIEKLCLRGYCSKNYKSSYRFAKRVDEGLRDVADLKAKGVFEMVAEKIPAASGVSRPSEPTVGLGSTFNKVWTWLKEDKQVGIVGLYGMGGVGKTTLLTQINNESLKKPNDFDIVIWVVVSRDLKPDTVQESIRRKIGFSDDGWKNKSIDERAMDIYNALSQKRFVMLLDDIWERVDLNKLGVPVPDMTNGSKVVFTTRSEQICGQMEAHKIVKVDCLEPEDAWDLFQKKVGDQTLCFHPGIPELARAVARECGGLPLALITIGRAMACKKTPQEWRHAIEEAEDCILSRDESLVDELQCLKELNLLTVTIRSAAALERLSSSRGMQNSTRVLHLENFHDSKLVNFSSLANMKNLEILDICHCGSLEEMQIDWERELQKMQAPNNLAHVATTERPFRSLSSVNVFDCLSLRNLNWLILAQNLAYLSVSHCPKMVEVASIEKLPEVPEVVENLNPFAKLKAVKLSWLPRLKSFYLNAPPLPSVTDVRVTGCPFLEKWPASQN